MFARSFKVAALAAAVVVATAGASFAATIGYIDYDTKVKADHFNGASTVNWVSEGQKVTILDQHKGWFYVKIPGQDGWIKADAVDFKKWKGPKGPQWDVDYGYGYGYGFGGSACVDGKNVSFCIGY
jgi:hypothetical protein